MTGDIVSLGKMHSSPEGSGGGSGGAAGLLAGHSGGSSRQKGGRRESENRRMEVRLLSCTGQSTMLHTRHIVHFYDSKRSSSNL